MPGARSTFLLKADIDLPDERLRGLRAEAERVLVERIGAVRSVVADLGLEGSVAPLAAGTFHVVHSLDDAAVVRSPLPGVFVEDRGLLANGIAGAHVGGLVPDTVAVRFGAPFDVAVSARAAGELVRDDDLDGDPSLLRAIGRALRVVHEVPGCGAGGLLLDGDLTIAGERATWTDHLETRLADHVAECVERDLIDGALASRVERAWAVARPATADRPMRLLHGDPGNHNVFVAGGEVSALVDWEDALVGDPLFDVASWMTFHPDRRHAHLFEGYELPAVDAAGPLLALYFLRIALAKTVHRARFGIADVAGRPPAHQRIARGLEDLERRI